MCYVFMNVLLIVPFKSTGLMNFKALINPFSPLEFSHITSLCQPTQGPIDLLYFLTYILTGPLKIHLVCFKLF